MTAPESVPILAGTYSSGIRYSSSSVIGGEEGGRDVRAMMCWSVMSVWVLMSETWESAPGLTILGCGARRRTWTMMGSLAVRKASTAWSWVALERSLPLTWKTRQSDTNQKLAKDCVWFDGEETERKSLRMRQLNAYCDLAD